MGAIGVDLFFVISGFVMALTAARFTGAHGAGTFLALRFVRIAPLYYLACLAMLVLVFNPGAQLGRETLLNSITFIPVFDDGRYSWPVHYLGWTLAFEFVPGRPKPPFPCVQERSSKLVENQFSAGVLVV